MPQTGGWFVVNARESRWLHNELGAYCGFKRGEASFDQLGVNVNVLPPGKPMAMYHEEPGQEDFHVLRGACLLIVEGEERPLGPWDFFHCPPGTKHVIVGAGTEPALVLAVGARKGPGDIPDRRGRGASWRRRRSGAGFSGRGVREFLEARAGPAPEFVSAERI